MLKTITKVITLFITNVLFLITITGGLMPSVAHCKNISKQSSSITWSKTGSMHDERTGHTTTLLKNGLVLVAGGMLSSAVEKDDQFHFIPCTTCELYNPATGTWSETGSIHDKRLDHTATLLKNGLVLVAGGMCIESNKCFIPCTTCELYNPATGTWSQTGSIHGMSVYGFTTLLKNGSVLIFVASGNGKTISCELYNPITGTWSQTGSIHDKRSSPTATILKNGLVLVAGGMCIGDSSKYTIPCTTCELYNPATGTWSQTGSIHDKRSNHNATLLKNGLVLVAGGMCIDDNKIKDHSQPSKDCVTFATTCELYNPSTGTWSKTGSTHNKCLGHTATLLKNGSVLIFVTSSDNKITTCELYNPSTGTWSKMTAPIISESSSISPETCIALTDDLILITGGALDPQLGRVRR